MSRAFNATCVTNAESSEKLNCDLIKVVSWGDVRGVKALLETRKYDVNYVNDNADTALTVAARRNDGEMMKLLIAYGAKPNVESKLNMGSELI
jgi:ankyrin repeat protein